MTHYIAVGATSVCMTYSILFLKLWSYIQVNLWCRNRRLSMSKSHLRRQSLSFHYKSKLIMITILYQVFIIFFRKGMIGTLFIHL